MGAQWKGMVKWDTFHINPANLPIIVPNTTIEIVCGFYGRPFRKDVLPTFMVFETHNDTTFNFPFIHNR